MTWGPRLAGLARAARPGLLVLVILPVLTPGCGGDDCTPGEVRCHENRAQSCAYNGDDQANHWGGPDCQDGFCHLSKEEGEWPFCSRDPKPDPRCSLGDVRSLCDSNESINCREGDVEYSFDCSSGDGYPSGEANPVTQIGASAGFCRPGGGSTFCVLEAAPNPACADDTFVCDGDVKLVCQAGYVVERHDCRMDGKTCSDAFCIPL